MRSMASALASTFLSFFIMAPQPLSRITRDPSFILGSTESLTKNHELGAAFGAAIAMWSYAESIYGNILVQLLGANAEPALAMLQALTSTSAQDQALEAAANCVLVGEDKELFSAAMTVARRHRRTRNALAHGVIGYSEHLPDAILVAQPRDCQSVWLELLVKRHFAAGDLHQFSQAAILKFADEIQVYKLPDLQERIRAFEAVASMLIDVAVLVTPFHLGRDKTLEALHSSPLIQTELHRRQKNQTAPPTASAPVPPPEA